jgi:hypothetical protein
MSTMVGDATAASVEAYRAPMGSRRRSVATWVASRRRQAELSGDHRAGAYARRQLRRRQLAWARRVWKGIAVLAGVFAVVLALNLTLMWRPLRPYVTGATVTGFLWALHVLMLQTGDVMRWQSGITAETWTAQALRGLRRQGWRLVNHVPTEGADIDHALIGPGGYLSVETKYRSGWAPDHRALDPIVNQALREARQLGARLKLGARARARPVVVAWGHGSDEQFGQGVEIDGVLFVAGNQLRAALADLPPELDDHQIEAAYTALDEYVTKVEPGEIARQGSLPPTVGGMMQHTSIVLLAAMSAALAVLFAVGLPPIGWWSVALATVLVGAAAVTRRRMCPTARLRHVTNAVMAAAGGTGVTILALLVVAAAA